MVMPKKYFFDKDNNPLAFGKIYTKQAGTDTDKPTFTTELGDVENPNPIILNSEGYAAIYWSGSYFIVVDDQNDANIWSEDNVSSVVVDEWVNCETPTYISTTSFKITGNVTDVYQVGRRVQIDNDVPTLEYSTIKISSFAAGDTTITVVDAVVDAGIVEVCVSIISKNSTIGEAIIPEDNIVTMAANTKKVYAPGDRIKTKNRDVGSALGAAEYEAVLTSTVAPNESNIVRGTGIYTAISFVLIVTGQVILSQFGINGDSDDSTKFQIALDYATTNNRSVLSDTDVIANDVTQTTGMVGKLSIQGTNNSKWTHLAGTLTTDALLNTIENFEISGVELDGNKDNQTNRPRVIRHTGDDFSMTRCMNRNAVTAAVEILSADNIDISYCWFKDIAEHGGTMGENSFGIHVDASVDIARCHINNSFFINGTPTNTDRAPVAIALSTVDGKCGDTVITGHTIVNFGRRFSGNQEGCIEVYKNCDRLVIAHNHITKYHFVGVRVSDSQDILVHHNTVTDEGSDIGASEAAMSIKSLTHDVTAKYDFIVDHNIIECATRGGMYIAGSDSGNDLHNAVIDHNVIRLAGESSLHIAFTDGEITVSNNLLNDAGVHNLRIQKCSGTIKVSGGIMKDALNTGLFCRTDVTNLDLYLDDIIVDTSTTYGYSCRALNSLNVHNCHYIGATPATREFDTTVTAGEIVGNSWQVLPVSKTGDYTISINDNGIPLNNTGAGGAIEFTLPLITSIPPSYKTEVIVSAAQQVDLDPNDVDQILRITNADGDKARNSGVIGSLIKLSILDGNWLAEEFGVWTDAN